MMDLDDVNRLVSQTVKSTLRPLEPSKVLTAATADSDGLDALRVTIVFAGHDITSMTGDTALRTIVQIQDDLQASGEERFAIVSFADEHELASHDDP